MRILKIKGKDEEVIKQQIQKEYGPSVFILSTHQEKSEGLIGFFKKPQCVVTIAIEEENTKSEAIKPESDVLSHTLSELKLQIDHLRKDIQSTRDTQPSQSESSVFKLFEDKLQNEGVHPDVVATLLQRILPEMEIDEVVRILYTNIVTCFKPKEEYANAKKIFFIGPTGVGKTTTIAKLTADKVLNGHQKVTLLTADTYRIAAIDQLRTYAEILDVPIEIVYEEKDLKNYLKKWEKADYIFIDTAGRSHKNVEQMAHMKNLLSEVQDKKVYLVINMNTQFQDLKKIIASYEMLTTDFELIVTKSDETDVIGNLLNIVYCANRPVAYVTNGQSVPDDLSVFDHHEYIKDLLGRISYE